MNLSYGKTDEGVHYLSHSQIRNFDTDSEQGKLIETVLLKTSSFDNDASGSFDLQPTAGMLIMDEATMTERRHK